MKHGNTIFQRFFTTNHTGQGTGSGLSLRYDIVKTHGRKLTLETKDGIGSMFTIALPISTRYKYFFWTNTDSNSGFVQTKQPENRIGIKFE